MLPTPDVLWATICDAEYPNMSYCPTVPTPPALPKSQIIAFALPFAGPDIIPSTDTPMLNLFHNNITNTITNQ